MHTTVAHPFLIATAKLTLLSYRFQLPYTLAEFKQSFFKEYTVLIEKLWNQNAWESICNVKAAMPTSINPALLMFAFNNYKIPKNINRCKILCQKNKYSFNERVLMNYKSNLVYMFNCYHQINCLLPETQTLIRKYCRKVSSICNEYYNN